ncbi:MAG: tetratricopeptide repeat protein [Pseudanabaena sp. CAN_BIN31]|nr:tetratricopeptide repeat protein [Pseudanabaena sp. CAN_BIN31]
MSDIENNNNNKNENNYDRLIVSLEAGLGTLQILLAVCDNTALRQQTMRQYEEELEAQGVRVYRLSINPQEPSLLQALIDGKIENASQAIATVTGAEKISNLGDRQTLTSFLGYLQWTREALRRYPMPIVLWLPSALLPEVANYAPDFWSWRGGTFTFKSAFSIPISTDPIYITKLSEDSSKRSTGSVLSVLQLEDSLAEAIKTWGEESANTEPIYYQLGTAYSRRVWKGEAIDREKEQLFAETYLNRAITLQKRYKRQSDLTYSLNSLGYMYKKLGYWDKAETLYKESLQVREELGDRSGIAYVWGVLGDIERNRGSWDAAEAFYRQSLQVFEEIGDRVGMASSWGVLGDIERNRGNWDAAEALFRQSLQVFEEIGDLAGMASSWGVLGDIERNRGNWDAAEALFRQSLQVFEEIGDLAGMASSWGALGDIKRNRGNWDAAEALLRQSLQMFEEIGDRAGIAMGSFAFALLEKQRGNLTIAEQYYEKAKSIFQQLGAKKDLERTEQGWLQ